MTVGKVAFGMAALLGGIAPNGWAASGADVLVIPLTTSLAAPAAPVSVTPPSARETYQCHLAALSSKATATERADAKALRGQLPGAPFTVAYYNKGENALAVLPLKDGPLVFANVISADGARYAAGAYIWWTRGETALFFSSMDGAQEPHVECGPVSREKAKKP